MITYRHRPTNLPWRASALALIMLVFGVTALAQEGPPPHSPMHSGLSSPKHTDLVFSEEELSVAADIIENLLGPEAGERLRQAAQADALLASEQLKRRLPRIARFLEMRRADPLIFDLRRDEMMLAHTAHRLAKEHRQAVADDRPELSTAIEEELREVIALQLDIRHELRIAELERLETRLDQLREELATQAVQRESLIQDRLAQLTDPNTQLRDFPRPPLGLPDPSIPHPPATHSASDLPHTGPTE